MSLPHQARGGIQKSPDGRPHAGPPAGDYADHQGSGGAWILPDSPESGGYRQAPSGSSFNSGGHHLAYHRRLIHLLTTSFLDLFQRAQDPPPGCSGRWPPPDPVRRPRPSGRKGTSFGLRWTCTGAYPHPRAIRGGVKQSRRRQARDNRNGSIHRNKHLKHDRKDCFAAFLNNKKYRNKQPCFRSLAPAPAGLPAFNGKPFACKH